jgi:hypothetical protein
VGVGDAVGEVTGISVEPAGEFTGDKSSVVRVLSADFNNMATTMPTTTATITNNTTAAIVTFLFEAHIDLLLLEKDGSSLLE